MAARKENGVARLVAKLGGQGGMRHNGGIRDIAVAPGDAFYLSVGDHGAGLHLWDPKTGAAIALIEGSENSVYAMALTPDGTRAFIGGHELQIIDVEKRKRVGSFPVETPLVTAIDANDETVLYGDGRKPRRFDLKTKKELAPMKGHLSQVRACAISADGTRAITCGGDSKVKVHTLNGKKPDVLSTLPNVHGGACGFVSDELGWVAGYGHAILFELATGQRTWELGGNLAFLRASAMSRDGKYFAMANDTEILIYEPPKQKVWKRLSFRNAKALIFDHAGKRLLAGSDDYASGSALEVFDIEDERRVLPMDDGHTGAVTDLAIPKDHPATLVSIGADAQVRLWDLESGKSFEQLGPLSESGAAVDVSADGSKILATTRHGQTSIWNVANTGSSVEVETATYGRGAVDVAFSPDAQAVAFAPYTGFPLVLSIAGGKKKKPLMLAGHKAQLCAIAFDPRVEKNRVYTSSADGHVYGWLLEENKKATAREEKRLGKRKVKYWADLLKGVKYTDPVTSMECSGFVNAIAVLHGPSPSGVSIATGTTNGEIALFDADSGKREVLFRKDGREVDCLATISEDEFASASRADGDWNASVIEGWRRGEKKPFFKIDLSTKDEAKKEKVMSLLATGDGKNLICGLNSGAILVFAIR